MKTLVNLFSFVNAKEFEKKGIAADVVFRERVYKEDNEFFFEVNGERYNVASKNGLVVHRHMNIPLSPELIQDLSRVR